MGLFRRKLSGINFPPQREQVVDKIRVLALSMHFDNRRVLNDIDLAVRRGEIFVVMGPSGCGKTTLLKHVCGLLPPTIGTVFINGRDVYLLPEDELNQLRRRMGMSFQGGALINSLSILDNVKLPLQETTSLPEDLVETTARVKLDMVGMDHARHLFPAGISGGMRKRAAIARAIALDPEIVFFDEPSAGLDPITAAEVDNLIIKLNKVFGITMVVVTHDLPSAFTIADRMIMLDGGVIIASGTKDEIRNHPDQGVNSFINRMMKDEGDQGMDFTKYLGEVTE